jgi:hypothetical protein
MNRLPIVILAICTVPLYAQGAQPDAASMKAEARNAVAIIGADKHKIQTYCQILDLERQQQVDQKNNNKKKNKKKDKTKAEALSLKINQLQKQIGTSESSCQGAVHT